MAHHARRRVGLGQHGVDLALPLVERTAIGGGAGIEMQLGVAERRQDAPAPDIEQPIEAVRSGCEAKTARRGGGAVRAGTARKHGSMPSGTIARRPGAQAGYVA